MDGWFDSSHHYCDLSYSFNTLLEDRAAIVPAKILWPEQLLAFKIACPINRMFPKSFHYYGKAEIPLNDRLLVLNCICAKRAGSKKYLASLWIQPCECFLNSLCWIRNNILSNLKRVQNMAHRQIAHLRWYIVCSDFITEKKKPKRKRDQGVNYSVILSCTFCHTFIRAQEFLKPST